jgi:isopenicillin-N epimerase
MSVVSEPVAEAGRQFLLRPEVAFLNHGSFGACPAPVFATYQRWQRELEAEPVEFLARRIDDLLAEARAPLARYLGTNAENLVFVPNATHGLNIVARSLRLRLGDEVLGNTHEYGAVERTWTFLCEQHGARYVSQPIPPPLTEPGEVAERLWQGVTPRTKVIVLSHLTSPTALIFPVAEVCRRAAEAGILTVIDGAHAPGQLDLALDALGADFYTGNCHKWLCAPKGAAFLYARPERQTLLHPLVVSWGWRPEEPSGSPFHDLYGWTGTADPSAYLSVSSAIAFQEDHDWPAVRAACRALLSEARDRLLALTGLPPLCPDAPEWWQQMCALPLPPQADLSADEMRRRLFNDFGVEVPIHEWQGQRLLRVSIQAYNTPRDVDRLVEGLCALLT